MHFFTLYLLSVFISVVSGHARIKNPKPLDAPPEDPTGNAYNAPLSPSGSDFPCKGLHKKAGVDKTPTQSWKAGSMASFEILGHVTSGEGALAAHSGGSCQASLSFDDGATWKAVHSFEGGCPRDVPLNSNMAGPDQVFPFMIPEGTKAGTCLFAWTWVAVTGNRDEFYMNCASVEITGSGTSTLGDYPDMFVGDMDIPGQIATGECRSTAGNALLYPNPGEVTKTTVAGIPFKEPSSGNCYAPGGGGQSSGTGSSVAAPTQKPTQKPTTAVAPPSSVLSSTYAAVNPTSYPVVKSSKAAGRHSSAYGNTNSPIGKSTGYQVAPPSSRPVVATTSKPMAKPTSYPLAEPTSYSSDDSTDYPDDETTGYSGPSPTDDDSDTTPTDDSGSTPTDDSGSTPTDDSGSTPTDDSGSTPSYGSGSTPTYGSGSTPTYNSGSTPTYNSGTTPTNYGSGQTTQYPTGKNTGYSFAHTKSYPTGGPGRGNGHSRGRYSSSAPDLSGQTNTNYPVYYSPTTMLTYTSQAVSRGGSTGQGSINYAQKVSTSAYKNPSTTGYGYV